MKINFSKVVFYIVCVCVVVVIVVMIGLYCLVYKQQKTIVDLNQEMIGNTESVNLAHQNIVKLDSRVTIVETFLPMRQLDGLEIGIAKLRGQNNFLQEENKHLALRSVGYSAQDECDCSMSSVPVMLFPIYDGYGNKIFYCDVECSHPSLCFISCGY